MYRLSIVLIAVVAVVAVGGAWSQEKKGAPPKLDGTWVIKRMVKRGIDVPADVYSESDPFTFAKGRLTIGADRSFTFKTDAKPKPMHLDLTAEEGDFKGQMVSGIYRFDGATLVICIPHDKNRERPDAFESKGKGGPSRLLFYLERAKD